MMVLNSQRIIRVITTLLLCATPYIAAAETKENVVFKFKFDNTQIDFNYGSNIESLVDLSKHLQQSDDRSIDSIRIVTSSSIDGKEDYNFNIANERAKTLRKLVLLKNHDDVNDVKMKVLGEDWSAFKDLIANDINISSYRDEIMEIINSDRAKDSKAWLISQIDNGKPWRYIKQNILSQLCKGEVIIYQHQVIDTITELETKTEPMIEVYNNISICNHIEVNNDKVKQKTIEQTYTPLFTIKTNLIYNALAIPNLEVEIPFSSRWSVQGEFARADCLKRNTQCWQIQTYGIETRYWIGNRPKKRILSGWFLGAFYSNGWYDFQCKEKSGEQGELYVITGLTGGYATRLSDHFTLEFSVGGGYVLNDYQKYIVENNEYLLASQDEIRRKAIAPLKAKISIGWLINRKK